ncbi:hypothetical protein DL96DRAFT_1615020 [Flagelloscypha sp. PMI_526]|nr:hypothetical protein DL96DRAFT_1615020 [Flagelloscypha sp. PMI_526]
MHPYVPQPPSEPHWRTLLHNLCKMHHKQLTSEKSASGPGHSLTWHFTYFVNGVEYGYGEGSTSDDAQRRAARSAYKALTGMP